MSCCPRQGPFIYTQIEFQDAFLPLPPLFLPPIASCTQYKKRRKSCLKCACLSAHTWGEGGSQVSSHMLSTSFTNKRIDGKIPGEHFTGVKLKKSSCTRIASVRRTKQLPRDVSELTSWYNVWERIRKVPAEGETWALCLTTSDGTRMRHATCKRTIMFRQQFLLLPLSLSHRHVWSLFPLQKPEKLRSVFCNYELNLKAAQKELMHLFSKLYAS